MVIFLWSSAVSVVVQFLLGNVSITVQSREPGVFFNYFSTIENVMNMAGDKTTGLLNDIVRSQELHHLTFRVKTQNCHFARAHFVSAFHRCHLCLHYLQMSNLLELNCSIQNPTKLKYSLWRIANFCWSPLPNPSCIINIRSLLIICSWLIPQLWKYSVFEYFSVKGHYWCKVQTE